MGGWCHPSTSRTWVLKVPQPLHHPVRPRSAFRRTLFGQVSDSAGTKTATWPSCHPPCAGCVTREARCPHWETRHKHRSGRLRALLWIQASHEPAATAAEQGDWQRLSTEGPPKTSHTPLDFTKSRRRTVSEGKE